MDGYTKIEIEKLRDDIKKLQEFKINYLAIVKASWFWVGVVGVLAGILIGVIGIILGIRTEKEIEAAAVTYIQKKVFNVIQESDLRRLEANEITLTGPDGAKMTLSPNKFTMSKDAVDRLKIEVTDNVGVLSFMDNDSNNRAHIGMTDKGPAEVEITADKRFTENNRFVNQRLRLSADGVSNNLVDPNKQ